jgi:hypothetical protein
LPLFCKKYREYRRSDLIFRKSTGAGEEISEYQMIKKYRVHFAHSVHPLLTWRPLKQCCGTTSFCYGSGSCFGTERLVLSGPFPTMACIILKSKYIHFDAASAPVRKMLRLLAVLRLRNTAVTNLYAQLKQITSIFLHSTSFAVIL